jgi:hypothetical protein
MNLADAPTWLTPDTLIAEIGRYQYRPGWTLTVFIDPWEGPCLYVVADLVDGYHPDQTVQVRIRSAIPPIPTTDYFGHWLLWRLGMIESHECREYLRRDTKLLFDPHDPIEPSPA